MTTIFALSSGRPPAAIGIIRISGPQAFAAATALAGSLPPLRRAGLRTLREEGAVLDSALVLRFAAPATATGEDLVELHCHGGRAVIASVEAALSRRPGLRAAEPGEFTRRALTNGRIDLIEAEGLADLLAAETETQRLAALGAVEGRLSALIGGWMDRVAMLSAQVEALLDYTEEDDVPTDAAALFAIRAGMASLAREVTATMVAPSVERLRDGVRVVIAGPPNAGKSTLLNLLAEREVAIVSPIAGTTRDRIEAAVLRAGLPFVLTDTAGLTDTLDPIEAIGVERAQISMASADILVWMGDDASPRHDAISLHARADVAGRSHVPSGRMRVAASDRESIDAVWAAIALCARGMLDVPQGAPVWRDAQRRICAMMVANLKHAGDDPLVMADQLATARRALASMLGLDATEVMLDALFSRFCIGK